MSTPGGRSNEVADWIEIVLDVWRAGQRLSAVGPGPVEAHLAHARGLAGQLAEPERAVDLGSGAGVPGLALAGLWPESRWMLVEAAQRRVRLLSDAIDRLGWGDRVTAVHGRAETLAHDPSCRGGADLVIARSFGPPAVTAECGVAFLRPDGLLVVTEPPRDADDTAEVRWPAGPLAELGLRAEPDAPRHDVAVQRLRLVGEVPPSVPRRPGIPAKRPRF